MRTDSVSVAKGRRGQSWHLAPRAGSRLRRLYDLLMAHKGVPLDMNLSNFEGDHYPSIEQLQDHYGLDILKLSRGRWVLAGEWFGPTYRDYIADRLASLERRAAE